MALTLHDLDESQILSRFVPLLPTGDLTEIGPGDDAAMVRCATGRYLVSTDLLVEGRHFHVHWLSARDLGYRAAMQNLADIAAMGGRPDSMVVAMGLPSDTEISWLEDLARGFADACEPRGVGVVGGDLSTSPIITVAVTVHGQMVGETPPVRRSGARPGDVVAHCGELGLSAAGLWLLSTDYSPYVGQRLTSGGDEPSSGVKTRGRVETTGSDGMQGHGELLGSDETATELDETTTESAAGAPASLADRCVQAFRRPTAVIESGVSAASAGAHALMDVSDGLIIDAGRIASASRVHIDLCSDELADPIGLLKEIDSNLAREWVLTGGEDHGLLATFDPATPLPCGFRKIGRVGAATDGQGAGSVTVDGVPPTARGWDHFGT